MASTHQPSARINEVADLDKARIRLRVAAVKSVIELLRLLDLSPYFDAEMVADDVTIAALRDSLVTRITLGEIQEFELPPIPPADLATQQARMLFRQIIELNGTASNMAIVGNKAFMMAQQWLEAHPEG